MSAQFIALRIENQPRYLGCYRYMMPFRLFPLPFFQYDFA